MNKQQGCIHCASPAQQVIEASEVEYGVPLHYLYSFARFASAKLRNKNHPSCCISENHAIFPIVMELMKRYNIDDLHILNAVRCRQAHLATTSATVESRALFFHELRLANNVYWCQTSIEDPFDHLDILATVADPLPTKIPTNFDYNWPTRVIEDPRFISPCEVALNLIGNPNDCDVSWDDIEQSIIDEERKGEEEGEEEEGKGEEEEGEGEDEGEEEEADKVQGKEIEEKKRKNQHDDKGKNGSTGVVAFQSLETGVACLQSNENLSGELSSKRGASREVDNHLPSSKRMRSSQGEGVNCSSEENEVNFHIDSSTIQGNGFHQNDSNFACENASGSDFESASEVRDGNPLPASASGSKSNDNPLLQGIQEALMMEKNEIASPFPKIVAEFRIRKDGVDMLSVKKDQTVSLVLKEEVEDCFFDMGDESDFEAAVTKFQDGENERKRLEELHNKQLKINREQPIEYNWQQAKMSQVKRNSSQGFVSKLGYEFQSSVDEWLSQKEKELEELMKSTPFYGYTINLKWRA